MDLVPIYPVGSTDYTKVLSNTSLNTSSFFSSKRINFINLKRKINKAVGDNEIILRVMSWAKRRFGWSAIQALQCFTNETVVQQAITHHLPSSNFPSSEPQECFTQWAYQIQSLRCSIWQKYTGWKCGRSEKNIYFCYLERKIHYKRQIILR